MSALFISHSSNDNALAKDLERRLAQRNHQSVFLDLDPEKGIVGGQSWERTLYRKLRSCRVVIALCTDHYLRSNWCFAELALARMEGKQILALQANPLDPQARMPSILMQEQLIDLRALNDEGYTRLWRALKELDFVGVAGEWNLRESPYLGLSAYQEKHAPVFFGREAESLAGIELLERGAPGLVMVLGASGSGKSSLVLAGMLPRLRLRDAGWLIVDPFRPGRHPIAELTESVAQTYSRYAREHVVARGGPERIRAELRAALTASAAPEQKPPLGPEPPPQRDDRLHRLIDLLERLQASPPPHLTERLRNHLDLSLEDLRRICDAEPAAEPGSAAPAHAATSLVDIAHDLRRVAERRDARVLIVIDQFEELLGRELADEEPRRFLQLLRAAVEAPHSPVMILATMRSDFLGLFQRHPTLQGIDFESLSLGPMGIEGMRRVIQMPARLAALDIEEGLVERLLQDTETPDALPLLSFTLFVLYRDRRDDSKLALAAYEQLGGLQGTVSREADAVLASVTREHREEDLRVALLQMARLSEDGSYARLAVDWDKPEIARAKPILDKLVERRVLVSRVEGDTRVVEVAHEALFRTWKPLQAWLDNSRSDLLLRQQLERDAATWQAAGRTTDNLWRGGRLLQANELFRKRARGESATRDLIAEFVRAGLRRRRRVRVTLVALTVAVIATLGLFSRYSFKQAQQARTEKSRALDLARVSVANDWITRDPTQGALLLLEVEDPENTRFASRLLSQALTQAVVKAEFQDVGPIHSVALTGDGSRLLTTARQQSTVWDVRTGQPVRIVQHEKSVLDGAFDPTGRFAVVRQGEVDDRYVYRPAGNEAWVYEVASGKSRLVARHDGPLNSAVFSPNGRLLATASDDHSARLWDVETGAHKGSPLQHTEKVERALFSPDGRLLATVSEDVTRVWNVETGQPARIPPLTGDNPAFSSSGMLAATRVNGGVQVWDLTTRNWKFPVLEHAFATILSFGVDDHSLLTASFQDARVWHGGRDKPIYYSSSPVEHENLSIARFSAGDSLIVTASGHSSRDAYSNPVIKNVVRVWDAHTGKRRGVEELKHDHEVMSLAFGPEAQFVVSNSAARTGRGRGAAMLEDSTARMWDVATRDKRLMRVIEREGDVSGASFSADGSRLLTVAGNSIRLYDWRTGNQLGADMTHAKEVISASFTPDGTLIVSASRDGTARTWDATSGRQLFVAKHKADVGHALLVANRRLLATLSGGALRLWDVSRGSAEAGDALFELGDYSETLNRTIAAESISPDGALVANRAGETVQIWDVKAKRQARAPLKHGGYVRYASFVDGGGSLVVGGDDKVAAVWDMTVVGDAPKFGLSHTGNVGGVEVSPDGRAVLTLSDDGVARLWDAATGRALSQPLKHSCALRFGMFIAGGRAVMTRSRDDVSCPRVVILWNVATGQSYSTMDMTGASAVGFSPNGTLMFSDHRPGGSEYQDEGTVSMMKVWNANTGELRLIEPFASKDYVRAAAFTPDGTHLMIASGKQVSLWAVSAKLLQSTLAASTTLCLKAEFRRQNLGETASEASERYTACERRRGRK